MEKENNEDTFNISIRKVCIFMLVVYTIWSGMEIIANPQITVSGNDDLFTEQVDRYNTLSAETDNVLELFDINIYGDEIKRYCLQQDSYFCELTTQPSVRIKEIKVIETAIKHLRDRRYVRSFTALNNKLETRNDELYEEIESVILSFGADTPFVKNWNYVERNEFSNSHNDNVKIFIATQLMIRYLGVFEKKEDFIPSSIFFGDIILMIAEEMIRENEEND